MSKPTAFIIGAGGLVGASTASALALHEVVDTINLIDINTELVHGQAMDLNDATAFSSGVKVQVGEYSRITPSDIVVITAGLSQRPDGQSRLDLLEANAGILRDIMQQLTAHQPGFIIVVSNPVDILTRLAQEMSGLPSHRVFGTGTALDTARLRVAIAQALRVNQTEIEAYVLGEHGDSSFIAFDQATIGGVPLSQFPGYTPELTATISEDIHAAAARIIAAKKNTYFGIGQVVAQIVEALLRPNGSIFPLSVVTRGEYGLHDIAIGLPTLVNNQGAQILSQYPLDDSEHRLLHQSASVLRTAYTDYHERNKTQK